MPRKKKVEEPREQEEMEELSSDELLFMDEEEEEEELEPQVELLCCIAGQEEFAFNVLETKELIKYQPVTGIPRCPEYVRGIISLRGEIISILDLQNRLGFEPTSLEGEPMIVVVRIGEENAGFLVEGITEVIKVDESALEPPPEVIAPEKAEFLKGVVHHQGRLVAVLNIENLLDIVGDFEVGAMQTPAQ